LVGIFLAKNSIKKKGEEREKHEEKKRKKNCKQKEGFNIYF